MKPITVAALAAASLLPFTGSAKDPVKSFSPGHVHIVLVGDSTVTDNAGWGKGFANALKDDAEVINLSRGGRSSKSAIAEGMLKKALDLKPDYIFIQFGHNDEPKKVPDPNRETDTQTTYKEFMTQYVDETKAAGVKPVLVTSLSRRQWGQDGKIRSSLQERADVVKAIAAEKQVPVIDLHARSVEYYEKEGKEKILEISPLKNADPGNPGGDTSGQAVDGTHLNEKGGQIFGAIVAEEVKKAVPELAPHVK